MINEPPLLTIKKSFERPERAIIDAFATTNACWVGDAMAGRGALDAGIRPIVPTDGVVAGPAITAAAAANSNAAIFGAIAHAQKGDIILAAAEAFNGAAVIGDVLAGMARNRGIAAIVIDGMVRDIVGLRDVGLPVYARGLTPNSCSREGIGSVGLPITIGGVPAQSGDVVVLDGDGVVVVPRAQGESVLATIEDIKVAESAVLARVADGLDVPDPIKALLSSDRVRYVD